MRVQAVWSDRGGGKGPRGPDPRRDEAVQFDQSVDRLGAHLVVQALSVVVEDAERVGAAPVLCERPHEQRPHAVAIGVEFEHVAEAELGGRGLATLQQEHCKVLDGDRVLFVQFGHVGFGPGFVREFSERFAMPPLDRVVEQIPRRGVVDLPGAGDELLELRHVDHRVQRVSGRCRLQNLGVEHTTQAADRGSECTGGQLQPRLEGRGAHDGPRMQREHAEEAALGRTGDGDLGAVASMHPEWPEQLDFHHGSPPAAGVMLPTEPYRRGSLSSWCRERYGLDG